MISPFAAAPVARGRAAAAERGRGGCRDSYKYRAPAAATVATGRRTLFWVGIALLVFGALGMMMGPVLVFGGFGMVFEAWDDDDVQYDESDLTPGDFIGMGVVSLIVGFPIMIIGIVMALIGRRK